MEDYLRNYLVALPLFVLIDFTWIGVVMKKFYLAELGSLARTEGGVFKPNLAAGLAAWAIIPLGLVVFAVPRLTADSSALDAIGWGALLGAICYGTYDLTNLSTLRNYSLRITLVDMAWGSTLSAVVTTVVWLVAR